MTPHKWHLVVTKAAQDDLNQLPLSDLMGVFESIRQLLIADNPLQVLGVKKLIEKRFEGLWRHRSGNWRIFFNIQHGEITHLKFTYKGTINIVKVVRRHEAY